jgi:hypothetical protein
VKAITVPINEVAARAFVGFPDVVAIDTLTPEIVGGDAVMLVGTVRAITLAECWKLVEKGLPVWRVGFSLINPETGEIAGPEHLFASDVGSLRDVPLEAAPKTYPSGIGFFDKNLQWRWRMRELGILAGPYSAGKSTVLQQLAFNFVRQNCHELDGGGALLCAWEDEGADMQRNLRRFIRTMDREHGGEHDFLLDKVHYVRRAAREPRPISWFVDLINFHRRKYGTRFFGLDPWNEMDHQRDGRQMETEYVRDMMRLFRQVVDDLRIILMIATHVPARIIRGDGSIEPFKIAHAFGSGNFANKCDRGLCVVRTKKFEATNGHAVFRLDKSKVEEQMGHKGTVAARLNREAGVFEYDGAATQGVQDIWKD